MEICINGIKEKNKKMLKNQNYLDKKIKRHYVATSKNQKNKK